VTATPAAGELCVQFGLCEQRFGRFVDKSSLFSWRSIFAALKCIPGSFKATVELCLVGGHLGIRRGGRKSG
jgi:hypothetical protein